MRYRVIRAGPATVLLAYRDDGANFYVTMTKDPIDGVDVENAFLTLSAVMEDYDKHNANTQTF